MSEVFDEEDLERMRRRRERARRMRQEKERCLRIQRMVKLALPVAAVVLAVLIAGAVIMVTGKRAKGHAGENPSGETFSAGVSGGNVTAEDASAGNLPEETMMAENVTAGDVTADDAGAEGLQAGAFPRENAPKERLAAVRFPGEKNPTGGSAGQYEAHITAETAAPPDEVNSTNVVFIDLASGDILAQRDYKAVINPASMTKVLTVLVAAEHVENPDDTFTMTIDITDYSYSNDCSSVGFAVGETVTVRDLFYGTILPSGGDAAVALATYVAGSHEEFVKLMNEKAEELGLSDTAHFTNCVGIYDAEHHCTVYDMAIIMEAALDNAFCREVLNAHTYTTSATAEHPEGITISNWFLRRIEDKDTGGEVVCAKTGYVLQSGNCAVSYGADQSGREYVCVTVGAHSSWRCIYDHVALYKKYAQE